jgi:hypothetical protein
MVTKKVRRASGKYTPRIVKPDMKYSEIVEEGLEPAEEYDDWTERRDGMRDWPGQDRKKRELAKERRK